MIPLMVVLGDGVLSCLILYVYEHLFMATGIAAKKHVTCRNRVAPGPLAACQATHEAQEEEDVKSDEAAGPGASKSSKMMEKLMEKSDRKRQAVEKSDHFFVGFLKS